MNRMHFLKYNSNAATVLSTCCGVVPGTSLAMLSQILGLEVWKSAEFIKVLSMRSRATALEAGPLLG